MRPGIISFHINAAVLPGREGRGEEILKSSYHYLPSPSLWIGGWIVLAGLEWIVGLGGVDGYVRIEKGRVSPSCSHVLSLLLFRALSALLLPRLPRKVIGRLFATLSGTKWAALPVDCCYLSSDKET